MKVAFQGERGAYSEAAAIAYFGGDVQLTPCGSFDEVYTCVTTANCDRGIVPIENTLAGSIHRNYDLLQRHTLSIVGEKVFRIHHCLIGHPNTVIRELGKIISHPQALAQCEDYIDQLDVEREPWYDTAGAVKWLAENGTRDHAAIASHRAAEVYGMQILAEGIEDDRVNYTRFLILSRDPEIPEGHTAKTSVVFTLPQGGTTPGSLFRALGVFALRDINLAKIESRPIAGETFEYVFYLDFEGSQADQNCTRAIEHLREIAPALRVLGSYLRDDSW